MATTPDLMLEPPPVADPPERLKALAAQSERDDTVLFEVLYRNRWVRFDVSVMEVQYLSETDLMKRYLIPALAAVQLNRRAAEADPASS